MFKRGGGQCGAKQKCESDDFAPQPYIVDLNDTEWTIDHYDKYIKQRKENRVPENPRLTTFRVKELDLSGYNNNGTKSVDLQLICSNFPNVEKLILSDNGLTELPNCIAYLSNLRWLDVNGNPFNTLPGGFSSFDRPNGLYLLMDDITPETKAELPEHFIINSHMNTKHAPIPSRSTTSGRGRGSRSTTSGRGTGKGKGRGRATNKLGGSRKRKTRRRSTRKRR